MEVLAYKVVPIVLMDQCPSPLITPNCIALP
jgi:hypothetical protein